MKILLISANTEKINMPTLPMGLGFVAAAVKRKGYDVRFLDLMEAENPKKRLAESLGEFPPDMIGISIRNVDDQCSENPRFLLKEAGEIVRICKNLSSAPTVLGGAGYSLFPTAALDFLEADMGIQGEGEKIFTELADRISAGKTLSDIPGLYIRGKGLQAPRTYIRRPEQWPFPDPELFDAGRFQNPAYYLPFQTRRGCPMQCSYCATSVIEGKLIRKRPVFSVLKELRRWREAGFSRIFFTDNTFNLPPSYAMQLCEALISEGLNLEWRCILYPGKISRDLARKMAGAGCKEAALGFESGNTAVLRGMNKRFGPEDIRESSDILADAGIGRWGFLLLGGPDENRDSVRESLEFADSLNAEAMKVTVGLRIYPHTRLADTAGSQGMTESEADLLSPRFYIKAGMEEWLRKTAAEWIQNRPGWSA
ncbi:MAG: radical SAM protein [Desulfococcaceae bacterium]|jgi:radical SAM superfamily enzyme YgiQ (UPF0313 family)|nr:radical SAM protein [Desulfococcaceae bacterium]